MYAVYAWGVPLVLTAVTAAMQFSDLGLYIITPGFGTRRCWFASKYHYNIFNKQIYTYVDTCLFTQWFAGVQFFMSLSD